MCLDGLRDAAEALEALVEEMVAVLGADARSQGFDAVSKEGQALATALLDVRDGDVLEEVRELAVQAVEGGALLDVAGVLETGARSGLGSSLGSSGGGGWRGHLPVMASVLSQCCLLLPFAYSFCFGRH